jgi:hypothetical protein
MHVTIRISLVLFGFTCTGSQVIVYAIDILRDRGITIRKGSRIHAPQYGVFAFNDNYSSHEIEEGGSQAKDERATESKS